MSKRNLTILVDMDDTIEDLLGAWSKALNDMFGTDVRVEDIWDWDLRVAYPSLTDEQIFSVLNENWFWKSVKPLPHAATYLKRLIDDGHEVYIVSSSGYLTIKDKMEEVLFKYFPFIDWNHVIITSNKRMIRGDVLVDDGIHNHIGGDYLKILMDAPHNRFINATGNGLIRVKSWPGIYRVINDYALYPELFSALFGCKDKTQIEG